MNVKQKGNQAEREVAAILREYGYEARRGLQYQGGQVEADVVGLPGKHIEVKRVERLNLHAAMEQSRRDAKPGEIPTVIHRRSREEWLITMPFRAYLEEVRGDNKGNDIGLSGERGAADGGILPVGDRDGGSPGEGERAAEGRTHDPVPAYH